jgi:hypothetical protein
VQRRERSVGSVVVVVVVGGSEWEEEDVVGKVRARISES